MSQRVDRSFIGRGPVYIKLKSNDGGFLPVGNCSNLECSFDEEEQTLQDFTSASGGNANALTEVSAFSGTMVMHDYSPENLALALRGTVAFEAAGAVTAEAHGSNGVVGEFIPFSYLRDATENLTVVKNDDSALEEGTDYTVENNGIIVLGAGGIDATGVKFTYTKHDSEVMEALTTGGLEYSLLFNGLNTAQGGTPVQIEIHRLKFSPAQGLQFITESFGEMSVDFEVLSDATKTGTGISKFMKVHQVAPA